MKHERYPCHIHIEIVNENHIYDTYKQCPQKQFLFKHLRAEATPLQRQFGGIIEKQEHKCYTKQHEHERQGMIHEYATYQNQGYNITNYCS
jgi:hypothetical protein